MNFSDQYNLRKPLSLILATTLTVTLFTGCMKKDTAEPADTTPQTPGISLSDTSAPTETEAPTTEATEAVNENTATVTSQINIRSSPSTEATIVGTLDAGDKVEISRREEVTGINWAYIISPEAGWIVMDYVEMDIPSQMPTGGDTSTPAGENTATEPTSGETDTLNIKGVVTVNNLNIRSEPDGNVQGSYNKGDVVTILETKNGWGRTNKGWITMEYVNTSGSTAQTPTGTTGNNTSGSNTAASTGNGSTTVQFRGIVTAKQLNIRASATKDSDSLGSYSYGARVEILEKSGDWGRTSKGWISLNYVYQDGTTGSNTAKGTITAGGGLNIRSGPGKGYDSVGSYAEGDSVTILEQFTYDGVTWGCTNKGWISMAYVDTGSSNSGSSDSSDGQKATVTTESGLRVRSGAGTNYDVVGSLKYGTKVTILSQKTVDGTTWGEISTGWICMDYVSLD
ncbi:MAG: SH3 domain-containing protein [Clostridiales bacterium]|nr:SH3 domain-containing protein [Clostridiales bacterium]